MPVLPTLSSARSGPSQGPGLAPSIFSRQSDGSAGGGGGGTCLGGGEIAGIVIGTIAGTLLILWLIRSCTGYRGPAATPPPWQADIEPKRHHKHHSRSHHSRRRSSGLSEPQPVIIADRSRSRHRTPTYVYQEDRGRR
ncbi:hypothetical protein LIA77_01825 [Sarocladium implicatum]|nr:hypothetical protein LIA77_01825 [Sarocladium implicatum]